jgi:hypothetical protein
MRKSFFLLFLPLSLIAVTCLSRVEGRTLTPPTGKKILIYGPSMRASVPNEETIAISQGHTVTVVDAVTWSNMTTIQFSAFDAIVFGDPDCELGLSPLTAAENNKAVWSAAASGPKIIIGTDPILHSSQADPIATATQKLIANGINFAASGGGTGLYVSLSCYYHGAAYDTPVTFLNGIGDFRVTGEQGDSVSIIETSHPSMAGLTDADLSNWGWSFHEPFVSYPSSFVPVANANLIGVSRAYVIATPAQPISNQPPTAGFTMSLGSQSATEGQTLNLTAPTGPVFVSFSANRSLDFDGTITGWTWRIDGNLVSTASSFTFGLGIGSHSVSLVVSDNVGASSQAVTGQIVINTPTVLPLKLFFSNDAGPNHALDINSKEIKRSETSILADVTITNRTGTWYQLTIDFNAPSLKTTVPVSDNQIPFSFLIGPFAQVVFRTTFAEGQYLHFNATRLSAAAISVLGIDLIGRGLFGVELSSSWDKSYVDLSLAFMKELLSAIQTGCAGDSVGVGFGIATCDGPFRIICILDRLAQFLKCTIENQRIRKAIQQTITHFYGSQAAKKWIEFGAKRIADIILIIDNVPKLVELIDNTVGANTDGFVRLEARR